MSQERGRSDEVQPQNRDGGSDHSDRRVWWTIVAVGVIVVVGLLVLGRPLVAGRLAAARGLDQATVQLRTVDGILAVVDDSVRSSSTSTGVDLLAESHVALSDARHMLESADALTRNGDDRLTEDEQKRAALMRAAVAARLAVVAAAEDVLGGGGQQAFVGYGQAVNGVKSADQALANQ